jgi:hypothetical protein
MRWSRSYRDLRTAEQRSTPPSAAIDQFRTFRFERTDGGFAINGRFFGRNNESVRMLMQWPPVPSTRPTATPGRFHVRRDSTSSSDATSSIVTPSITRTTT